MAKPVEIERADALSLLTSPEVGNGNLDDKSNEELVSMIDDFMSADDTDENMEFEDAEAQAVFSNLCEIYNDEKTITIIGEEEEEAAPKKTVKKAAAKKVPVPAKKTPVKKVAPTKPEKAVSVKRKMPKGMGLPKLGKLSLIDSTFNLLKEEKVIMTVQEIIDLLAKRKLWASTAPTPGATLATKLVTEIINKGEHSRFERVDRGLYKIRGMKCPVRKAEPVGVPQKAVVEKKTVAAKSVPVKAAAKKTKKKVAAKKK